MRTTVFSDSLSIMVTTMSGMTTLAQGLTLVHFSAQPEPFLQQKHTLHIPQHLPTPRKEPLNAPPIPQKPLTFS